MDNGGISSLIGNLRLRVFLLVVVWCLQKDADMFSTKRNVLRDSDSKKYSCKFIVDFQGKIGHLGHQKNSFVSQTHAQRSRVEVARGNRLALQVRDWLDFSCFIYESLNSKLFAVNLLQWKCFRKQGHISFEVIIKRCVVYVTIESSQKWIKSQNCEIKMFTLHWQLLFCFINWFTEINSR